MAIFRNFFSRYPAFGFALLAAAGAELGLHELPFFLVLLLPLSYLFFRDHKDIIYSTGLGVLSFLLVFFFIYFPEIPEEGIVGTAKISIEQLSLSSTAHQSSYIYKGKILSFSGENIEIKGVPFYLSYPAKKKNRPLANCNYEITCRLKKGRGIQAILKPLPSTPWIPLSSFSFSESRHYLKQTLKNWMETQFTTPSTVQFLSGLVIGELMIRTCAVTSADLAFCTCLQYPDFISALLQASLYCSFALFFTIKHLI